MIDFLSVFSYYLRQSITYKESALQHYSPHPRFRNLHLDFAWYSAARRNELSGYTDGNQLPARFALRVYHTVKVVFLSLPPNGLTAASWMPDGMVVVISKTLLWEQSSRPPPV